MRLLRAMEEDTQDICGLKDWTKEGGRGKERVGYKDEERVVRIKEGERQEEMES